jgi:exopolyphosphatase/guanosine-5'-triphosphate,3'-diphosphate pyrophosphatase
VGIEEAALRVLAAIDIGANSARLKISRIVRHALEAIHEDRVVTRLGESVFRTGALSPRAMDATVKVLRRFHRAVQKFGVDRVRVVATSAVREARNAMAFVAWVHSATGWTVETISGLEEGRLIHLGVVANSRISGSRLLLADLGGGSCELTISNHGHIREMASLPLGAVRLTQEFLLHDPPTPVELHRLQEDIREEIDRVSKRIEAARVTSVLATSGTAAAIAGADRAFQHRSKEGPVSRAAVIQLAERLSRLDVEDRAKLPGIGPRRAQIIVAGAHVYAQLMKRCKLRTFRYSPLGLRDGMLSQMLAEHDQATVPRKQIEAERRDAVLITCRHYHVDVKAAQSVQKHCVQLFRELRSVHNLPLEYETWLSAAALLQDVGSFINRSGRHRHTHYLISNSEIFGFTPEQRRIIAAVARYVGKSRPDPGHEPMQVLSRTDQEMIPRAVVLLRLARAMNHGHGSTITRVTAVVNGQSVLLKLKARTSADLEVWVLRKERAYFREVFGHELNVELL